MSDPDFFAMASRDARTAFRPRPWTHWSYHDTPQWALCGERIEPEQFNRVPTCPACLASLEAQRLDDQR